DRFEKAWQLGRQPNINDYIPVECSQRRVALRELSRVDLEFRLKAGEDARLESYLTSFPELADDRDAVLGLIVTEFDLRRRRHSAPSLEEYQCRFPQLADHLPTCLKAGTKRKHAPLHPICPYCLTSVPVDDTSQNPVVCPACRSSFLLEPGLAEARF